MGAGKTSLIKAICKHLGIEDSISSPTFSIVNEYQSRNGQIIYHFDFYRIRKIEEVYDIGFEDYFDSGNICLLEWPEKISKEIELPANDCLDIWIENSGNTRLYRISD